MWTTVVVSSCRVSRDGPDSEPTYDHYKVNPVSQKGAKKFRDEADRTNAETAWLNKRIHQALVRATGLDEAQGPFKANSQPETVHPDFWWNWREENFGVNHYFNKGTEVWTNFGLMPIEEIMVGDRVLARDSESGDLTFSLVTGVDTKSQSVMRRFEVAARVVVATPEQPLFITDVGWKEAGELQADARLDGLAGSERVEGVGPGTAVETYGLIVEHVHNFFVERRGILVHDATQLSTKNRVPAGQNPK